MELPLTGVSIPEKIEKLDPECLKAAIEKSKQEIALTELEIIQNFAKEKNKRKNDEKLNDVDQKSKDGGENSAPTTRSDVVDEKETSTVAGTVSNDANCADKPEDTSAGGGSTSYNDIWRPPPLSIPVRADVRNFDFRKLASLQRKARGTLFDVIMTDPPWQLATSNPTRGVAIGYQQLSDSLITEIPFPELQDDGFLFMWVINAKYKFALELMEKWGYRLVDEITWVKRTVNRKLAKSHGFYLQHAKETCLVGLKGKEPDIMVGNVASDVIYSERRGQSQKPIEIYEIIEALVPNGSYLEIFARRNNLRDGWVSLGNEL